MNKIILFLAITAAGHTTSAQKIQVTAGTKLETIVNTEMKMGMEVGGQTMDNVFKTTNTSDVELKSADKTGYVFLNTLKRVTMNTAVMGQETNFDSDKPADLDGEMGQAFKGKLGKTDTFQVSPVGRIVTASQASAGAGVEMTDINQMMSQFTVGQPYPLLAAFPAGSAPKQGDSWTDSTGSPETVKVVTAYKLESIQGDDLIISFAGVMTKNGTMEQQGMEIQMDMSGPMTGTSTFDRKTGLLKNNATKMDIKGHMAVAGQEFDFSMLGNVTTEVKNK